MASRLCVIQHYNSFIEQCIMHSGEVADYKDKECTPMIFEDGDKT